MNLPIKSAGNAPISVQIAKQNPEHGIIERRWSLSRWLMQSAPPLLMPPKA